MNKTRFTIKTHIVTETAWTWFNSFWLMDICNMHIFKWIILFILSFCLRFWILNTFLSMLVTRCSLLIPFIVDILIVEKRALAVHLNTFASLFKIDLRFKWKQITIISGSLWMTIEFSRQNNAHLIILCIIHYVQCTYGTQKIHL